LRQVAGKKTVEFPLAEGATVRQLLDAVVERFPTMRDDLFDGDGRLYPHVHVFINGRDAPYLAGGLDTPLSRSDTVDLFPAIGGG